jgi:hypothetical protein
MEGCRTSHAVIRSVGSSSAGRDVLFAATHSHGQQDINKGKKRRKKRHWGLMSSKLTAATDQA